MPPDAIDYREVGIGDAARIARVNSDTLRECELAGPELYDFDRVLARWESYLSGRHDPQQALKPRVAFGAFLGSEMVGYVAGHFTRRFGCDGEVQSAYVRKRCHRRGIGSALLARLARWFADNGRVKVCVGVDPANPWRGFYERHGARRRNDHWLVWEDIRVALRD